MGVWKGWARRNRKTWEHLLKWKRLSKAEGVTTEPDQYQVMHEHMEVLVTLALRRVLLLNIHTCREEDTTKEKCLFIIIICKGCVGVKRSDHRTLRNQIICSDQVNGVTVVYKQVLTREGS